MDVKLIYHPKYNITFFGLEKLHPFDSRKYGRAWARLKDTFGRTLKKHWIKPVNPIREETLLTIHSRDYLQQLQEPAYLAQVLEMPLVKKFPHWLTNQRILKPMRWATQGSLLAAENALKSGLAINLSGGYHHAKPNNGEGFCVYSDVSLAVHHLRQKALLKPTDHIIYIDLDAHQGNGVCHNFMEDTQVHILDMYNAAIYPFFDLKAKERIDCNLPLSPGCTDDVYLSTLKNHLPQFLTDKAQFGTLRLAIYNAGTDIYANDQLGGLAVSEVGVLERDLFVLQTLAEHNLPTVMVLSGGYSQDSYRLVANTIEAILKK